MGHVGHQKKLMSTGSLSLSCPSCSVCVVARWCWHTAACGRNGQFGAPHYPLAKALANAIARLFASLVTACASKGMAPQHAGTKRSSQAGTKRSSTAKREISRNFNDVSPHGLIVYSCIINGASSILKGQHTIESCQAISAPGTVPIGRGRT